MDNKELGGDARRMRRRFAIGSIIAVLAMAVVASTSTNVGATAEAMRNMQAQQAAAAAANPAADDPESIARGLVIYRDRARCTMCHAWDGHVARVEGEPLAKDLTTTELSRETLIEVVGCGRPSSGMPNHLRGSYTDAHPCYGFTTPLPADMRPRNPLAQISETEVIDVVNYVQAVLQGHEMTFQNCVNYFQREAPQCERFRGQ